MFTLSGEMSNNYSKIISMTLERIFFFLDSSKKKINGTFDDPEKMHEIFYVRLSWSRNDRKKNK